MKKILFFLLPVFTFINAPAQNWQLVASTSFDVLGPRSVDFYALDSGRTYKMVMSGLWGDYANTYHYDTRYSMVSTITDFGSNVFITYPVWLMNLSPTPAAYDSAHFYNLLFTTTEIDTIHLSFVDNGYTDNYGTVYFELYQDCPITNHPFASDTSGCMNRAITLVANNAANYTWYDSAFGGTVLSMDDSLLLASLSQTDTFYVSTMHYTGCESNRDTVIVMVNPIPAITFNLPGTDDTTCTSHAPFILTGESPAGGTFNGTGVTGNMFDPSLAGPGTHTITYYYADNNGCDTFATQQIYVDVCTGIAGSNLNSSIRIFPNPNNGIFQLQLPQGTGIATVQIINTLGEIVYSNEISEKNNSIDISGMAPGMYIAKISSENKTSVSNFIKQ